MNTIQLWSDPPIDSGNLDLDWETFHESSKLSMFDIPPSDHEVLARMAELAESLEYHGYPIVDLPAELSPLEMPLGAAIRGRSTAKQMIPSELTLEQIGTILHGAYGITRDLRSLGYPRPFRTVPSGGALYPLELYFHCQGALDAEDGLYHYNPTERHLRLLREGSQATELEKVLVQGSLAHEAPLLIFITAVFDRSVFKYGDRGYRFALLEAGHVAQNINLTAHALGLGSINLGGFYDRRADDLLDIDGLTHATVYMVAVGRDGALPTDGR